MSEKNIAVDLLVKGSNLCRFLENEKDEHIFSKKLIDAISSLSEIVYSINSPSLTKAEVSQSRKMATLEAQKANLYLNALYISGFLSEAQKDSMQNTLSTLTKEFNI